MGHATKEVWYATTVTVRETDNKLAMRYHVLDGLMYGNIQYFGNILTGIFKVYSNEGY